MTVVEAMHDPALFGDASQRGRRARRREHFGTIVTDPPWPYANRGTRGAAGRWFTPTRAPRSTRLPGDLAAALGPVAPTPAML